MHVLKSTLSECPSYDLVVPSALKYGWEQLPKHCHLVAGTPVLPMLAKPEKSGTSIFARLEGKSFTCEYKYDGERAQIHLLPDGTVRVFSRNMEDNTGKYPDIAKMLPSVLREGVSSVIVDSEVVAYDPKEDRILPFQTLAHRKKKASVEGSAPQVKILVVAFDLLLLNGESLLRSPLAVRRKSLRGALQETKGMLRFAVSRDVSVDDETSDENRLEDLSRFLDEAVEKGTEGLMVKTLEKDASYEPSVRSLNWLKLKKDYLDGCGDTFDLVPIGAWHGKGKRTGVFGAYLVACYDPEDDQYQSACKVGTGFSDVQLKELTETMKKSVIPKPPSSYCYDREKMTPDVWFDPVAVWEIKAADMSVSPVHMAGAGHVHDSKGIGLRFPRLLRVRDDKEPENATTSSQVADMYLAQKNLSGGG